MSEERIELSDIEDRLRGVQESTVRSVDAVRPAVPGLLAFGMAGVAVVAFIWGYRRGRNKSSVIEITRI